MERTAVVDGANVVGSRPDGWWKDRLGAARRLRDHLGRWAASEPTGIGDVILVVEGKARPVADDPEGAVRVVAAPGSGDDTIVDVAAAAGAATLVVTADRELQERVRAVGADIESPSWLWSQLDAL